MKEPTKNFLDRILHEGIFQWFTRYQFKSTSLHEYWLDFAFEVVSTGLLHIYRLLASELPCLSILEIEVLTALASEVEAKTYSSQISTKIQ